MKHKNNIYRAMLTGSLVTTPAGLLLMTLFTFTFTKLSAQETWSLNRCINYAIENNIGLKKMEVATLMAQEDYNQSKRNLLPELNATSSVGWNFGRSIDPNTNDFVNTGFFNNSYGAGTSVTLFNAFKQFNTIEYQKFRKKASELNRLNAADNLAFLVMTSYYDVAYHVGLLEIAKQQVSTSLLNLKKMEKMVELGLKSKTDLLEISANYEAEELRRIQVENKLKTAKLMLRQSMNYSLPDEINVEMTQNQSVTYSKPDQEELFNSYIKWSPFFQSFETQLQANQKAVSISRSHFFPRIGAFGGISSGFYETTKDADGNVVKFGKQFNNNRNQYLGASINIPVFNRLANRSEVAKAKLERDQAKLNMEEEKQKMYFEMAGNLNEIEALEKEYYQGKRQQEADQQAFRAAELKFEQGLMDVVSFYIAKNRLANTETQVIKARLYWEEKKNILDFYGGKRFWENPAGKE